MEARAFIGTNTMKTGVSAYHMHRAAVVTGEPIALAAQAILDKYGYFAAQSPFKKTAFAAIRTLERQVRENPALAERTFAACVQIAESGGTISGDVLDAVYTCQKKMQGKHDILSGKYLDRLKHEGISGIEAAIRRSKHAAGMGGTAVTAIAILDMLNKGQRKRILFPV